MRKQKITPTAKNYQSDCTRFKLCIYYSHKPDGTPYNVIERNMKKHRKYHDSYDYIHSTAGKTVTREDYGYNKLLIFLEQHKAHIEFGLLFVNDFVNQKQHLIGKFFKDENRTQLVQPMFTNDEYGIGHVYFHDLHAPALETSNLQQVTLRKQVA